MFEINPLDIELAKIQMNLIIKLQQTNDIGLITEEFINNDRTLNISKVLIKYYELSSLSILELIILDNNNKEYLFNLKENSRIDILKQIKNKIFFDFCKDNIQKVSNEIL